MRETIDAYPVHVDIDVAWGDMDAFAHVNNAKYFVYFETARIAYFEKVMTWVDGSPQGVAPILASTGCRFKAPVTYPDQLIAGVRVREIEHDRFTMEFAIHSKKLNRIVTTGDGVVVAFDYDAGQKAVVPDEWRTRIAGIEGWPS